MKKNKRKHRLFFIILIIVTLVIIVSLLNKKPKLKENLTFEINSIVKVSSLLDEANKIKVNNTDEIIESNKLGEKEVIIKYNNKEYKCIVKIVDTTKPTINYKKELTTKLGKEIDLLKNVNASDNSNEKINVTVKGDYDFKKAGTYHLKYVATDSSNNIAEEDFTLNVGENSVSYKYPKLDSPEGEKELVGKTSKGYNIYKINGNIYIDDYIIANKTYSLSKDYIPTNSYKSAVGVQRECSTCIDKTAYEAWMDMKTDASALGLNLWIQSGYRSYSLQTGLYNRYVNQDGKKAADTYSARPGHSEHQTGLAFDLNTITESFANTTEGKWVTANAHKYGFILRYPKGKDEITGYIYEPWHFRYVGTKLATELYNDGNWITMEEHFGIDSKYED